MPRAPCWVPASRSIPPPWGSIRFRLALRTCAPWGVRVVSQTKSRKLPTRKILPLFFVRRHRDFRDRSSPEIHKLRRILVGYSLHNPVVGYCQGLNMLAAAGVLVLPEEMVFWMLVAVVEHILPPGYYSLDMVGSQVRGLKRSGSYFRVGIFLDFVRRSGTARAEGPHGTHVRRAERNRNNRRPCVIVRRCRRTSASCVTSSPSAAASCTRREFACSI